MRKILCSDYITYEDVMASNEIFVVYGSEGTFFFCFDYYAPEDAKLWYKFSTNPFDIDFLKFKKVQYGMLKKDNATKYSLDIMFHYLHSCRECYIVRNVNFLTEIFFQGGKTSNVVKRINKKCELDHIDKSYYGKINPSRAYRLKSNFTNSVKCWLFRLFKEYNFMDDSIEYIKEYYDNWVILVSIIQDRTEKVTNEIWKFIHKYDIHNFDQFMIDWNRVINKEIKINLPWRDVAIFNNVIQIIYREKCKE